MEGGDIFTTSDGSRDHTLMYTLLLSLKCLARVQLRSGGAVRVLSNCRFGRNSKEIFSLGKGIW